MFTFLIIESESKIMWNKLLIFHENLAKKNWSRQVPSRLLSDSSIMFKILLLLSCKFYCLIFNDDLWRSIDIQITHTFSIISNSQFTPWTMQISLSISNALKSKIDFKKTLRHENCKQSFFTVNLVTKLFVAILHVIFSSADA